MKRNQLLERLWSQFGFKPNDNQRAAILHEDGPLFLPAGPGSGKTRVLLWRVTNLVVARELDPCEIYLSTFTEKAALQLREGLRGLLAAASEHTRKQYDISRMYVGTVHSLCQRLLVERTFQPNRGRGRAPALLDELDQYLLVNQERTWQELLRAGGFDPDEAHERIARYFGEFGKAKHTASSSCISFFNRLSEECIDPTAVSTTDADLRALLAMYGRYLETLSAGGTMRRTDFSLLQQEALTLLESNSAASKVFRHVIVDEYQDTNTVQERLFFRLAEGHKNICVVGDDDQALYRFRGATVENFVQFPVRCAGILKATPKEIPLDTNYRSRSRIVAFYGDLLKQCDWKRKGGGAYRVEGKQIRAHRKDDGVAVVASTPAAPTAVCAEIAGLVRRLIDQKRVADPNQIAFLYPSLKTEQVKRMKEALEEEGLRVYAPRAGSFLETPEATAMLGLFALILGRPKRGAYQGDYKKYYDWLDEACRVAEKLVAGDRLLARFVKDRQSEIARAREDHSRLLDYCARKKWDLDALYAPDKQQRGLANEAGVTPEAQRRIASRRFNEVIRRRLAEGNPLTGC